MCQIIPFPQRTGFRKALGKQLVSISRNRKHASASRHPERDLCLSTPPQAPTTFHMEVTVKLTWETRHAQ